MPNHAGRGSPGCAKNAVSLPRNGIVFGAALKLSLNCSTTGSTTARLLMISISASVRIAPADGTSEASACEVLFALLAAGSTWISASAE